MAFAASVILFYFKSWIKSLLINWGLIQGLLKSDYKMNALYMKRATDMQFRDPRELTPASYNIQVSSNNLSDMTMYRSPIKVLPSTTKEGVHSKWRMIRDVHLEERKGSGLWQTPWSMQRKFRVQASITSTKSWTDGVKSDHAVQKSQNLTSSKKFWINNLISL